MKEVPMAGSKDKTQSPALDGMNSEAQARTKTEADHLYDLLRPLHHLPRGKNTWNPAFLKKSWFWPASVAVMMIFYYLYPLLWDFFAGP
jgi:hypothetical protein